MSNESINDDEESPFLAEMQGVTPLKQNNKMKLMKIPKKPFRQTNNNDQDFSLKDTFISEINIVNCPDILNFSRSGMQHKALKLLRQGKNPIEHTLDLHGLTVDQARSTLFAFLRECEAEGVRYVVIIHGKGYRSKNKPVIKPMLNHWLRSVENVLAFHSAQPVNGGTGAVYAILKKRI